MFKFKLKCSFVGALFAAALIATTIATTGQALAVKIQKVTSPGGVTAWLVEDHSRPLMAMNYIFRGGSTQDPDGLGGVAYFLSTILDEGAGDLDSNAFQERMEDLAVKLSFTARLDSFSGSFQTLTANRAAAAKLLRDALARPRLDSESMERMRRQILAGLHLDATRPGTVAGNAWYALAFKGHPYSRPTKGNLESVAKIDRGALETYRKNVFAKDNLIVAVVGDITADELAKLLDDVFGDLAAKAKLRPIPEAGELTNAKRSVISMKIPQAVARFGHQGFKRKDPDFIPAYVLNYIFGGGGFTSRLMQEVRVKNGLAYSVYSYLSPMEHAALLYGAVATKNDSIDRSLKLIRQELEKMLSKGPTQKELDDAKRYLTGSYALRFDTSAKIASQLMWIQFQDLGSDYIAKRNEMINAVTLDDLKRVAKRLLKPGALLVTIVGDLPDEAGKEG